MLKASSIKTIFRWPVKLGFFQKITVHIILMTLLTGIAITAATAYQFRQEMYRLESDSALMVYAATISSLNTHHYSESRYDKRGLDLFLEKQFMRLDETAAHEIAHRPRYLVIYDWDGEILYEYRDPGYVAAAPVRHPHELPLVPVLTYERAAPVITVTGPVDAKNPDRGFVLIQVPTHIKDQLDKLLVRAMLILSGVLSATVLLSILFTRQVLSPIRALTRAAQAVHRGDWQQHVDVVTDDEIGELATTFNDMIYSMDRRMDVMHRMQEWTMRIGRQMDAKRLFETLGEMFERMSMARAYRLYLHDADRDRLVIRLEQGGGYLPAEDDDLLARMALRERWAMYLKADGSADNEPLDVVELAIPLLSGKHRIGVIRMGRRDDQELYDDDTLTILQTLAQHASVAIDNANLYERLTAQERMAQEMTLARQIQQSMLPRKAPVVSGYEIVGGSAPALEVGGDYFDYIEQDNETYVMIGDVSGKGVPAALIMSIVRALIHTYLEFETSPKDVLWKVNRNISQDLDEEMFVTMSSLQLNAERHTLTLARAGHEPFMIAHAGGTVDQITPRGTALGMLEVEDFENMLEEVEYPFALGDTVLLYTDGITEAQNTLHEEFGYDRLEKLVKANASLSVRELFERIIDEIHLFSSGVAQLDDITLVLIRRNE
jgi:serine phosphatase RsbU (regulator of sigma subunit)/HAMP domain-containing protein